LEAELMETLRTLGIERVEALLALPRDQLRSRFGPSLLMRIDQTLGTLSETFVAIDPPPEFIVEQLLEHPLAKLETLRTIVALLTQRLARHLAARCAGALRIACRFRCEASGAVEFEAGWFEPTASPAHLQEIIDLEMERLQLPTPATGISIVVLRYALLAERQKTLFGEERCLGSSQPLAALVDRLVGRLGSQRVVRHRLQPEAQPELAFRKIPLISGKKRRSRPASESVTRTIGALDRPLFLLRRPLPLDVMAMLHEGPPERFRRAGEVHHVLRYAGPERIETGWWRGNPLWRDYFRVETAAARRFWIFRRWPDGRWFLHGVFG
jgi:protein ImuB